MGSLTHTDKWQPGCWCVARLKLCDAHLVEGEAIDVRYPEQWLVMLWRPALTPLPFLMPDAWHITTENDLEAELAHLLPDDATVYWLSEPECSWSTWLRIPLVTEWFEPWLVEQFKVRIAEQTEAEQGRYRQWFGDDKSRFDDFLKQLLTVRKN